MLKFYFVVLLREIHTNQLSYHREQLNVNMARASARARYFDRVLPVLDVHINNMKVLSQRYDNTSDIFR